MGLNRLHERREAAGYPYLETDIQFSEAQLWKFPVTALNAGLAAGLLGIGGGMVIGPLFIDIGMQPQVMLKNYGASTCYNGAWCFGCRRRAFVCPKLQRNPSSFYCNAQVGTSSCAYMILWTAVSGVVQYYYAGKLGWQFMALFAGVGFVSGQIGQNGVQAVLKKTGRPSVVVLLLGGIIGLACVVMTISTAVNLATEDLTVKEMFALDT